MSWAKGVIKFGGGLGEGRGASSNMTLSVLVLTQDKVKTRSSDLFQSSVVPLSRGWEKLLTAVVVGSARGGGRGRASDKQAGGCGRRHTKLLFQKGEAGQAAKAWKALEPEGQRADELLGQ